MNLFSTENFETPDLVVGPMQTGNEGRFVVCIYSTVDGGVHFDPLDVDDEMHRKEMISELRRCYPNIAIHDTSDETEMARVCERLWPSATHLEDVEPAETMAGRRYQTMPPTGANWRYGDFMHRLGLVDDKCTFVPVDGDVTIFFSDGSSFRWVDRNGAIVDMVESIDRTPH
jgi:hypothetical protein